MRRSSGFGHHRMARARAASRRMRRRTSHEAVHIVRLLDGAALLSRGQLWAMARFRSLGCVVGRVVCEQRPQAGRIPAMQSVPSVVGLCAGPSAPWLAFRRPPGSRHRQRRGRNTPPPPPHPPAVAPLSPQGAHARLWRARARGHADVAAAPSPSNGGRPRRRRGMAGGHRATPTRAPGGGGGGGGGGLRGSVACQGLGGAVLRPLIQGEAQAAAQHEREGNTVVATWWPSQVSRPWSLAKVVVTSSFGLLNHRVANRSACVCVAPM